MNQITKNEIIYTAIWGALYDVYQAGFIGTERGLQAALYEAFLDAFPKNHRIKPHISIEPPWKIAKGPLAGETVHPDMVVVNYDDEITDIFELKYQPHWKYPKPEEWGRDILKLFSYVNGKCLQYTTQIDSVSGQWLEGHMEPVISRDCKLHFVVVAQPKAEVLCTEIIERKILQVFEQLGNVPKNEFYHWAGSSGPSGKGIWDVTRPRI